MGVSISIRVSKSVTEEEWTTVYEEALKLVEAFPLAEKAEKNICGIDTICLVKTKENERPVWGNRENTRLGWCTIGDYENRSTAEAYCLYRDLVKEHEVKENCLDAMLQVWPDLMDYDWDDERFRQSYSLWGDKTQGHTYHMYLLAIACLIESRLKNKACVYGDITRGQCVKAVEMANEVLDKPITIPDRCDVNNLLKRIATFPVSDEKRIKIFDKLYMGNHDAEFGKVLRKSFSPEICDAYWKEELGRYRIDQCGFDDKISNYLLWGFDLEKVCDYVNFSGDDGTLLYESFIKRIMDAKLHLKEKNCIDHLKIDQDEDTPYGVGTLFAQFFLGAAKNLKVDRYIPIEEIRRALNNALGDKCDVNAIIDEYLLEEAKQEEIHMTEDNSEEDIEKVCEQDASEVLSQMLDQGRKKFEENMEKFDVSIYEHLLYYEKGDTILPGIKESLRKSIIFYNSLLEEDIYKKLMESTPKKRCEFLSAQNRFLLLTDKEWEKIYTDIKENESAFARYYSMVRVNITNDNMCYMVSAIVLNDELYAYCGELAKQNIEEEEQQED